MVKETSPPLTAAQQAFCTDGTLLRYLCTVDSTKPTAVSKAHTLLLATLKWRDFDADEATRPCRVCKHCEIDDANHCFFSIDKDNRRTHNTGQWLVLMHRRR